LFVCLFVLTAATASIKITAGTHRTPPPSSIPRHHLHLFN
jgi:hypothetical protein